MNKNLRVNERIRTREVRLVDADGSQLGIMSPRDALRIAEERQLDLVEVAPQAKPPVCRIMDFGKYKYEQSKREKEAKKKQKIINIKEVKMRPSIEDHDFNVKLRNIFRFLKDGDKVKVTVFFRGREIVHNRLGQKILNKIADMEEIQEIAVVERKPKLEGRNMIMILIPRHD